MEICSNPAYFDLGQVWLRLIFQLLNSSWKRKWQFNYIITYFSFQLHHGMVALEFYFWYDSFTVWQGYSFIHSKSMHRCLLDSVHKKYRFWHFKKTTIPNFKYEPSDFNLMINDVLTAKIRVIQTTCKLDRSSILSTHMALMW
jgi:hypothetical protein